MKYNDEPQEKTNNPSWVIQMTKYGPSLYEKKANEYDFHGLVTKRDSFSTHANVVQYVRNKSKYGQTSLVLDEVWESKTQDCLEHIYMLEDIKLEEEKKKGVL